MRCRTHCPEPDSGVAVLVAAVVTLAALAAIVVFVAAHAAVFAAGLVLVAAGTAAVYRLALRHTVQQAPWLARARARAALPPAERPALRSAPLAIEPRHVIPGVVVSSECHQVPYSTDVS